MNSNKNKDKRVGDKITVLNVRKYFEDELAFEAAIKAGKYCILLLYTEYRSIHWSSF